MSGPHPPLSCYETFSVGGRCDAGHIFLHSNRGFAILSGLQFFPVVGEHARYALLLQARGFSKRQDLLGAPA
jgi:hypothetical protein